VKFPLVDNGELTGWVASIGNPPQVDTQLYILYGKIQPQKGESGTETVGRLGAAKMARDGGFIESQNSETYQGYPALEYTINRVTFEGEPGYENSIMFLKDNELYVIESLSRYQNSTDQFNQVINHLAFT
jgi:hypothetical protein